MVKTMFGGNATARSWPPRPTWAGDFHQLEASLFRCDVRRRERIARLYVKAHVPERTPLIHRTADHYVLPLAVPALPEAGSAAMAARKHSAA
jgi:hypothetical protein